MEPIQLTDQEVRDELAKMAYRHEDFQQLVTFVWALPDQFWSRVCKRLVATAIVGVQEPVAVEEKPRWHEGVWRDVSNRIASE